MNKYAQPVVILHIPKTAGTSLRRLIQENCNPEDIFYIYGEDSQFTTLRDFRKLTQEEKSAYKIFMGHIHFNPNLFAGLQPTFITMLRDPVDRVLSYYHHVMQRKEWQGNNISLLKYIETSGDGQISNLQTRMLNGYPKHPVDEKQLETAMKNLENNFQIVGTTEKFEEVAEAICEFFGWEHKAIFRENVSEDRIRKEHYSEYEIEKIREINRFDLELYDHVTKIDIKKLNFNNKTISLYNG